MSAFPSLIPLSHRLCKSTRSRPSSRMGVSRSSHRRHNCRYLMQPLAKAKSTLWTNFEKLEVIGKGSFGTALLCRRRSDGCLIVLKVVDLQNLNAADRRSAVREAELLSMLSHENIVAYYGCHRWDGQLFIEMEYCEEGTLADFLVRQLPKPLPELDVLSIFRQIVCALTYLDEMSILHRDLKTSNIFLAKNFVVKVGDFGIAKILSSQKSAASTVIGTPMNFSPEVCEGKRYSLKSDIWASGCILYEIICLRQTFDGANLPALIKNIVTRNFKEIRGPYSRGLKKLVSCLLNKDPDLRPRAYEVLEVVDDLLIERRVSRYQAPWTSCGEPTGYAANLKTSWNSGQQVKRSLLFQLKISPRIQLERVRPLSGTLLVKQVSKSKTHLLLLADDGTVYQINKHSLPSRITCLQGKNVSKVAAGCGFSIFLCDRGLVMSSGDPKSGCLGKVDESGLLDDSLSHHRDPEVLDSLFSADIVDISCASNHVVACCSSGLVYAWGVNVSGCLGLGEERVNEVISLPTIVPFPSGTRVGRVFCGEDATMFVDQRKGLWATGSNDFKKLGLRSQSVHAPVRVKSVSQTVDSASLSKCSSSLLLASGKVLLFGKRIKSMSAKCTKFSRGKMLELGNGIIKSQTTSRFDVALTVENEIYFWGKRAKTRSSSRSNRISRTLSKVSDTVNDANITIGESDVPLMEIIRKIGPDSPVILIREPALIALDMKQLKRVDGEEELFVQPQLVTALYSSQIHLKQGETISFSDLYAFEDDSIYLVIDTSIDPCPDSFPEQDTESVAHYAHTSSDLSYDFGQLSNETEGEGDVPHWLLRELIDSTESRAPENASLMQQDMELRELHRQLEVAKRKNITLQIRAHELQEEVIQMRCHEQRNAWKRWMCCCFQ